MSASSKTLLAMLVIISSGLVIGFRLWWMPAETTHGWFVTLHVLCNMVLLPFVVMPFFIMHRRLLVNAKRPMVRWSGLGLEFLFYSQVVIGLYLLLIGNQDGLQAAGRWFHFSISIMLFIVIFLHLALVKWVRLGR